jgi:hypothetical protein
MLRCVVGLVVFNLAARALGYAQPPNPALRGFAEGCEGKPQPCWYGIVPGQTSLEVVQQKVEQAGYRRDPDPNTLTYFAPPASGLTAVKFLYQGERLVFISPIPAAPVRLGDVMAVIGAPSGMMMVFPGRSVNLMYSAGALQMNARLIKDSLSPFQSTIQSIYLTRRQQVDLPWHGFARLWRYAQLESGLPICCD